VVLRIEEQALWFDSFVQQYSLAGAVKTIAYQGFKIFQADLNESTRVRDVVQEVVGLKPWGFTRNTTSHTRNSESLVTTYYTAALARKVFDLQRFDFERFGYPAWDGRLHTFRAV